MRISAYIVVPMSLLAGAGLVMTRLELASVTPWPAPVLVSVSIVGLLGLLAIVVRVSSGSTGRRRRAKRIAMRPLSSAASSKSQEVSSENGETYRRIADLRERMTSLREELARETAELHATRRKLEEARKDTRDDERERVLVAVRALRKLADESPELLAAEALVHLEAVVTRLDEPWVRTRSVPPLPRNRTADRVIQQRVPAEQRREQPPDPDFVEAQEPTVAAVSSASLAHSSPTTAVSAARRRGLVARLRSRAA